MNNYEGWHHIGTAPKNKEVLVWDGRYRSVAEWNGIQWVVGDTYAVNATHWRGCPPPPPIALPDDEE